MRTRAASGNSSSCSSRSAYCSRSVQICERTRGQSQQRQAVVTSRRGGRRATHLLLEARHARLKQLECALEQAFPRLAVADLGELGDEPVKDLAGDDLREVGRRDGAEPLGEVGLDGGERGGGREGSREQREVRCSLCRHGQRGCQLCERDEGDKEEVGEGRGDEGRTLSFWGSDAILESSESIVQASGGRHEVKRVRLSRSEVHRAMRLSSLALSHRLDRRAAEAGFESFRELASAANGPMSPSAQRPPPQPEAVRSQARLHGSRSTRTTGRGHCDRLHPRRGLLPRDRDAERPRLASALDLLLHHLLPLLLLLLLLELDALGRRHLGELGLGCLALELALEGRRVLLGLERQRRRLVALRLLERVERVGAALLLRASSSLGKMSVSCS